MATNIVFTYEHGATLAHGRRAILLREPAVQQAVLVLDTVKEFTLCLRRKAHHVTAAASCTSQLRK